MWLAVVVAATTAMRRSGVHTTVTIRHDIPVWLAHDIQVWWVVREHKQQGGEGGGGIGPCRLSGFDVHVIPEQMGRCNLSLAEAEVKREVGTNSAELE